MPGVASAMHPGGGCRLSCKMLFPVMDSFGKCCFELPFLANTIKKNVIKSVQYHLESSGFFDPFHSWLGLIAALSYDSTSGIHIDFFPLLQYLNLVDSLLAHSSNSILVTFFAQQSSEVG